MVTVTCTSTTATTTRTTTLIFLFMLSLFSLEDAVVAGQTIGQGRYVIEGPPAPARPLNVKIAVGSSCWIKKGWVVESQILQETDPVL